MFSSIYYILAMLLSVALGQTCLKETNTVRAAEGRTPVKHDAKLVRAAENHNNWMMANNCFSHQCPGEPSMTERVNQAGYAWWGLGEILAAGGWQDCEGPIRLWMGSSGHRGILLGNYNDVGCATGTCNNCSYWKYYTCVYGVPRTLIGETHDMNSSNATLSYQVIYQE